MPTIARLDEFAFVLLAGVILIGILALVWTTPTEAAAALEPPNKEMSIPKGSTGSYMLTIKGTKLSNVTLSATGDIKNWITFSKNDFDVFGSTNVTIKIKVPSSASTRTYSGRLVINSAGGQKTSSITINVLNATDTSTSAASIINPLGDFSISYSVGSTEVASKQDIEVSRGYFSGRSASMTGSISDDEFDLINEGEIELVVEDTNSAGNLIVWLNNEEVYSRRTGIGSIEIPIDKEKIKKSNTISISADSPGWMFWMTNTYKIKSAKMTVSFKGEFSKEIEFSLPKEAVDNFRHLQLNYLVSQYSSPLPELTIKVNKQIIYMDRPPLSRFNMTFSKDILGNELALQEVGNKISFSFDSNALYEISGAVLTFFYSS